MKNSVDNGDPLKSRDVHGGAATAVAVASYFFKNHRGVAAVRERFL